MRLFSILSLLMLCTGCSIINHEKEQLAEIAVYDHFKAPFLNQIKMSNKNKIWDVVERDIVNYFASEMTLDELKDYNEKSNIPIIKRMSNGLTASNLSAEEKNEIENILQNSSGIMRVLSSKFQAGLLYTIFSSLERNSTTARGRE